MNKFKNKFIVFEGFDATGKTSVAKLLADKLNSEGIDTIMTRQPGGDWGPLATTLRSLCKDKRWELSSYGNMHAFMLDKAECIAKIIRPNLKAGKTVICDRHTYSCIAYQFYGKQIIDDMLKYHSKEKVMHVINFFKNPYPDVTPNIIYYFPDRVGNRSIGVNDLFETAGDSFETRVKQAYEDMASMVHKDGGEYEVWKTVQPGNSAEETLNKLLEL